MYNDRLASSTTRPFIMSAKHHNETLERGADSRGLQVTFDARFVGLESQLALQDTLGAVFESILP